MSDTSGTETTSAHLDEIPRAGGLSPDLFFVDSAPLPNRTTPPQDWIDRDRHLQKTAGTDGPPDQFKEWDMWKTWNATFGGGAFNRDLSVYGPFAETPQARIAIEHVNEYGLETPAREEEAGARRRRTLLFNSVKPSNGPSLGPGGKNGARQRIEVLPARSRERRTVAADLDQAQLQ
jgi:hypothetical protein